MEYFVAETYKNWDRIGEPYNKNGKLYIVVKESCPKCGGTGIYAVGVENGKIKPHPAYGGVCLKCESKGYLQKEVRLYTESEFIKMTTLNEVNKEKKEAERERKIKEEYAIKRREWLDKEGFNEENKTYIVKGDSYSIKEELKSKGFRYSKILKWHKSTPGDYDCIEVSAEDILDFNAWGTGAYHIDAAAAISKRLKEESETPEIEWYGEVGEKITDLEVKVQSIRSFDSVYGISHIYTFAAGTYIFTWFTSTIQDFDKDDTVLLSGTIKDHTEYNDIHQTVVSRCKCKLI